MTLRVVHTTQYRYSVPATESHNEVRVQPFENTEQHCLSFALKVMPAAPLYSYTLPGGVVHHFTVRMPHTELAITAEMVMRVSRENPFTALQFIHADCHFYDTSEVRQRYFEFLTPTNRTPLLPECAEIAAPLWGQVGGRTASFLLHLCQWIHSTFRYDPDSTHVHTQLHEVLEQRSGVCQDFAHLMLALCRHQGIPARYVSGYLYNGERAALVGADATHAWIECLLPDGHWCGFDPTNNLVVNGHYIKVHHGRDYDDVPPIKGTYRGVSSPPPLVSVRVTRE